jgi:hypothetical protein
LPAAFDAGVPPGIGQAFSPYEIVKNLGKSEKTIDNFLDNGTK